MTEKDIIVSRVVDPAATPVFSSSEQLRSLSPLRVTPCNSVLLNGRCVCPPLVFAGACSTRRVGLVVDAMPRLAWPANFSFRLEGYGLRTRLT